MKIVGLTRDQLQKDVNEAWSSLGVGRIQAAPSPAPAHKQKHAETHTHTLPAQPCNLLLLPLLAPAGSSREDSPALQN